MNLISSLTYPSVIEIIGLLFLLHYLVYVPLRFILSNFAFCCFASRSRRILTPRSGDYAMITGATDGIGLEYAKQLASKGYNLFLLSRTEEKLERVAEELQETYSQCKNVGQIT